MPILLDHNLARQRFDEALALARSDTALPTDWLDRATRVALSPSKTFVAMLGTALLAKATNSDVDPSSLKARDYPSAYSARNLCTNVLVPCADRSGIHLGTTGREPLNNQPFFRHENVSREMVVRPGNRPYLEYLCESLEALRPLSAADSLMALSAFLRTQTRSAQRNGPLLRAAEDLETLVAMTEEFVTSNPELGRRGQALLAAALDLVFDDVRTARVNDPSRHWPGDVVVGDGEQLLASAEAKQRQPLDSEIMQFAERCQAFGIRRAFYAVFPASLVSSRWQSLPEEALRRYRVNLTLLAGVREVLGAAVAWMPRSVADALTSFPRLLAERLSELEVSDEGQRRWAEMFRAD